MRLMHSFSARMHGNHAPVGLLAYCSNMRPHWDGIDNRACFVKTNAINCSRRADMLDARRGKRDSDQARLQLSREGEHGTSQQFILQNDRTISTNALKF